MSENKVAVFQKAAQRGVAWLISQQREDGSLADVEDGIGAYYKSPYAFLLAGRVGEARRLLDWVAKHHFTAEGDFRGPTRKANEDFHEAWPTYSNAWLVQGAHLAGRYDMSLRGAEFLLRYQTDVGGFYALDGENRFHEGVGASWCGLAMLMTGRMEEARRAGDMLVKVVQSQPNPDRYYYRVDMQGNLVTDVPAGAEIGYYVDTARTEQVYFQPGIALIFFMHLYRATGEAVYLEAGQKAFEFTQRCAEDVHRFPTSGKLGSGAALLWAVTGNADARQAAIEVGDYLTETQTSEGFWRLPDAEAYAAVKDPDNFDIHADLCSEFSTFLMEIASLV